MVIIIFMSLNLIVMLKEMIYCLKNMVSTR